MSARDEGDHFRLRVLQAALSEALEVTWRRRAATFERARSRPGDHLGGPVSWEPRPAGEPVDGLRLAEVAARDARLTAIALACHGRAALAPLQGDEIDDAVALILAEAATS